MIKRDFYLNKLIRNMWNGEVKVITGIRRCGKSVLLFDLFLEYLLGQGIDKDHILRIALDQYMLYGGMPRITAIHEEADKKTYLKNLYEELYVKDIVERNNLEGEDLLNEILDFIASQVGSLTNPTNIANTLSSMCHEQINPQIVSSYLSHAMDAFLIEMARR